MTSKKWRIRATYTDDSDNDSNVIFIHEEQTSFDNNWARKKSAVSQAIDSHTARPSDLQRSGLIAHTGSSDDLNDFFSLAVHEITLSDLSLEILPPETDSSSNDSTYDSDNLAEEVSPIRSRVSILFTRSILWY